MPNPFEKRATEYLRDSDTFLSIITPEPLKTFFKQPASEDRLYDRLTIVIGTPGSGKTTVATLLQFHFVDALRRNQNRSGYKELVTALTACRAIDDDGRPTVAGVRIPLEAEYRDFWELPYSVATRTRLVMALLQARSLLGWFRTITESGHYPLESLRLIPKQGADAAILSIGGIAPRDVRQRAVEIERAVYDIGAALVPPDSESEFPDVVKTPYHPFDALEAFEVDDASGPMRLTPLVMLDDAHTLHPEQLTALRDDLGRRELRIARWLLTRLDVLSAHEALLGIGPTEPRRAAPQLERDVTTIELQKGFDRASDRKAFRRMARDMANRYLLQMPEFRDRGHDNLADLLETVPEPLADGAYRELVQNVTSVQKSLQITDQRRALLEAEIERYFSSAAARDNGRDVRTAMLSILMHQYANRVPQGSLFDTIEDREPRRPLKADSGLADAARIHLAHAFNRPLYYGINAVCDASSENAEQFLHLAGRLVAQSETRLLRKRSAVLESRVQHRELQKAAIDILASGDYPYAQEVRALTDAMANDCLAKTLEGNASLDGGASAIGIPQKQFESLPRSHPRLAQVLQFAVAYNTILLVPNYGQGNKIWCLLELGGCVLLKHKLTLRRGGFLERTAATLAALLPSEDA